MASFAYDLMQAVYAKSREALAAQDWDGAYVWGHAEGLINNVHHGKSATEWLPIFYRMVEDNKSYSDNETEKATWDQVREFAEELAKSLSS